MPPHRLLLCRLVVAVTCAGTAGAVRAELIKVSPFLPPQAAANAATPNAPLEFRGEMSFNEGEQYRVVDPARKIGSWLKVGERDANLDVVIKQHDAEHDTITVEHGGQTMTLALKTSKVVSSGAPMPQVLPPSPAIVGAPGQQGPNVSPAVLQSVVPNPTPADEQRRLEAVAAEVARRRAMREQAAQSAQQGQPAPNTVPQPNATRQDVMQAQQMQQLQQGVRRP